MSELIQQALVQAATQDAVAILAGSKILARLDLGSTDIYVVTDTSGQTRCIILSSSGQSVDLPRDIFASIA